MTDLEIMQRAKMYMDKLAQGIDPLTDEEVPEDSLLNNVRLARCFFYVSGVLQQVIDNGGKVKKPKKNAFTVTPELKAALLPVDHEVTVSEFANLVAAATGEENVKRPSARAFTDWLLEKGFLEKSAGEEGQQRRIPTEAGTQIGMFTEPRQGQYGEYLAVYYTREAQQFLIDHLEDIFG